MNKHLRNVTGLAVVESVFAVASILISFELNPFWIEERFLADEPNEKEIQTFWNEMKMGFFGRKTT